MWLSEKASENRKRSGAEASVGPVTISGSTAAVLLSGESRGLEVLAPCGVRWQPEKDTQVMVLQTSDGERFILGAAAAGKEPLRDGELCFSCGETMLKLTRDGIFLTGKVFVNGNVLGSGEET